MPEEAPEFLERVTILTGREAAELFGYVAAGNERVCVVDRYEPAAAGERAPLYHLASQMSFALRSRSIEREN